MKNIEELQPSAGEEDEEDEMLVMTKNRWALIPYQEYEHWEKSDKDGKQSLLWRY